MAGISNIDTSNFSDVRYGVVGRLESDYIVVSRRLVKVLIIIAGASLAANLIGYMTQGVTPTNEAVSNSLKQTDTSQNGYFEGMNVSSKDIFGCRVLSFPQKEFTIDIQTSNPNTTHPIGRIESPVALEVCYNGTGSSK